MRQELPAVELLKTAGHFLPKPDIVIEIVLHELLHVFIRAAPDIGGNLVDLRLQFGCKVHFHDLSVGKVGTGVKGEGTLGIEAPVGDNHAGDGSIRNLVYGETFEN
jgi:hypothetical protein